jgi:hypothetical protein
LDDLVHRNWYRLQHQKIALVLVQQLSNCFFILFKNILIEMISSMLDRLNIQQHMHHQELLQQMSRKKRNHHMIIQTFKISKIKQ